MPLSSTECRTSRSTRTGKVLRHELLIPAGSCPSSDHEALMLELMLLRTQGISDAIDLGYWINIHSRILKQLLTSSYPETIRSLASREPKQLEVNGNHYQVDEFCKSYRLPQQLRSSGFRKYTLRRAREVRRRFEFEKWDHIGRTLAEKLTTIRFAESTADLNEWDQIRIALIQCGELYASRCKYGRFHSNFTSLSKRCRSLLRTADGKPLYEVDVANCQPLLMWLMLNQEPPQCGTDLEAQYQELCEQGKIYEYLMFLIIEQGGSLDRDSVKEHFIKLLFQSSETMDSNALSPVVSAAFPEFYRRLKTAKEAGDYAEAARKCQRLESKIMLEGVCQSLLERFPDISLVTVHDSILVPKDYVHEVKREISRQFSEKGVSVRTRTTKPNLTSTMQERSTTVPYVS
jgi:hypothetical protein